MEEWNSDRIKRESKVCPFCGCKPDATFGYMPNEVEITCTRQECMINPSAVESVESIPWDETKPNGSHKPLFEKAWHIVLKKWNTRY